MRGSILEKTAFCAVCILFAGCIFAPAKYGPRGVVVPGLSQYHSYLANCCARYRVLAEVCRTWGDPTAIQIGDSGGYFVWSGRQEWVVVKSFRASVKYGRHPSILRPYVDGSVSSRQVPARSEERQSDVYVIDMSYSAETRKGFIVMAFRQGQYEIARAKARANIETLVKDKNVMLVTDARPEAGRYMIGKEEILEEGRLRIEFEAN